MTAGIGGENGSKGGSIPTSFSGPLIGSDVATMVSTDSSAYTTARPKAFLNWMAVGEDYVAATGSTNHVGTVQIPVCNAGDTMKSIVGLNRLVCRRNGWIYIYVSNESNQDVYFDNLVINLTHGPVVEQKDYYAFGMQHPALSTQAIKYQYKNNRYTYTGKELQSQEFVDSSGLNEYDFGARFYDPVIARWNTEDPLSEKNRRWSTYAFTDDNSIRFIDPDGMDTYESYGQKTKSYDAKTSYTTYKIDGKYVSASQAADYAKKVLAIQSTAMLGTLGTSVGPTDPKDGGNKDIKNTSATTTTVPISGSNPRILTDKTYLHPPLFGPKYNDNHQVVNYSGTADGHDAAASKFDPNARTTYIWGDQALFDLVKTYGSAKETASIDPSNLVPDEPQRGGPVRAPNYTYLEDGPNGSLDKYETGPDGRVKDTIRIYRDSHDDTISTKR